MVKLGAPQIKGDASGRIVSKAISRAKGRLAACAQGRSPGQRAIIKFIADEEGFFEEFSVAPGGDSGLGRCAIEALKAARRLDRRPDTGIVEIALPIRVEAGS